MNNYPTENTYQPKINFSIFINKYRYLVALGIFISYLCLTLYKIGENSLWYDECFSIDWANDKLKEIIDYSLFNDTNPPLYLIILHYWLNWFGDSEFALRSLSALATSIACGVFFLFCLRFFNWQTAIFAILLFFSSNELYYYAQEGRTYGLIILFFVLSNFAFMSLVKKPTIINAVFLGLFNIAIFYLHTLACLSFIAQIILIPFLTFDRNLFLKKHDEIFSFLGFRVKHIIYYIISWLVFLWIFWPWKERFLEILSEKGKGFWLAKPTFEDLQKCVYEFYNSKELFFTYLISFIAVLVVILIFKKFREESYNYKLVVAAIVLGPVLLLLNYVLAVNMAPIFLKRYVLFTLLGFILAYAYVLSSLKINFKIKLSCFTILFFFTIYKMKVPRESFWDFEKGVELLKKVESPTTYIATDIPMLYAYYRDRKVAFKAQVGIWRDNILNQYGVFTSYGLDWPNQVDFTKYTDIYYTSSFGNFNDPNYVVENILNKKFVFVENLDVKGTKIIHYVNPVINPKILTDFKNSIKSTPDWYKQVISKAKDRNISVDSMLTLDAIWAYKNTKSLNYNK